MMLDASILVGGWTYVCTHMCFARRMPAQDKEPAANSSNFLMTIRSDFRTRCTAQLLVSNSSHLNDDRQYMNLIEKSLIYVQATVSDFMVTRINQSGKGSNYLCFNNVNTLRSSTY